MAIGLLAVGDEEIDEPRSQIARDVLGDDRDAVGVWVEERMQVGVGDLRHRALAERLVVAERAYRVAQVRGAQIHAHGSALTIVRTTTRPLSSAKRARTPRSSGGTRPAVCHSGGGGSIQTCRSRPVCNRTASL